MLYYYLKKKGWNVVRTSFLAGWKAAGGEPPQPHRIFEIYRCEGGEISIRQEENI
jgi:hypothetical protein